LKASGKKIQGKTLKVKVKHGGKKERYLNNQTFVSKWFEKFNILWPIL
jgi:hypothetical protein